MATQTTRISATAAECTNYIALNLKRLRSDTHIYRVFPKKRLFDLFDSGTNVLVRPSMWEDPFENFMLQAPVRTGSGDNASFSFHDDFYGQCWTLLKASDAMWRIYSQDKTGVRVRTTIEKLARGLSHTLGNWAHAQSFIGRVEYLSEPDLRGFSQTAFEHGLTPAALAQSLLVKRMAFKHEREVRLLYLA